MKQLNQDIDQMEVSILTMDNELTSIDAYVGNITNSTYEMAHRFSNVQRSVNLMQDDVHTILRPLSNFPWNK